MEIKLQSDEETIKKNFLGLKTKYDVADILEVDFKTLVYLLYRIDTSRRYKTFTIKKKSGGERVISAPITTLKIIQRKLANILNLVYIPRRSVYGFCKERNIKDNAAEHLNKKVVFNVDLKDFFPSIHIGRVIGLFRAYPFNFPKEVATILAQIACHEGKLPQGSPTSPIISNMVCFRLDQQLNLLAKDYNCNYSRYADDLSFSSRSKKFPSEIGYVNINEKIAKCGSKIKKIIQKNNFVINENKVRLSVNFRSQIVTGLVVNKIINVRRKYVRNLRAILHSWRLEGIKKAEKRFFHINPKVVGPFKNKPSFSEIILGKIQFIRMIKGQKSPVYRRLMNAFNQVMDNKHYQYALNAFSEIENALWVIESFQEGQSLQGTGFFLEDYGIVTAYHVVLGGEIEVYKYNNKNIKYKAKVYKKSPEYDIALLEIVGTEKFPTGKLKFKDVDVFNFGDTFTVAGFPDFNVSDGPTITDCKITGVSQRHGRDHFMLDYALVAGMSGGPVLDSENNVVGVLWQGKNDIESIKYQVHYAGIPIKYIDKAN